MVHSASLTTAGSADNNYFTIDILIGTDDGTYWD